MAQKKKANNNKIKVLQINTMKVFFYCCWVPATAVWLFGSCSRSGPCWYYRGNHSIIRKRNENKKKKKRACKKKREKGASRGKISERKKFDNTNKAGWRWVHQDQQKWNAGRVHSEQLGSIHAHITAAQKKFSEQQKNAESNSAHIAHIRSVNYLFGSKRTGRYRYGVFF